MVRPKSCGDFIQQVYSNLPEKLKKHIKSYMKYVQIMI